MSRAAVRRALVSDVALCARAARALAGVAAAGSAAGVALALLPGRAVAALAWLLLGLCCGAIVGLALAAWAVADRRHARRAGRARDRLAVALALAGLAVPALGAARSPDGAGAAIALGAALGLAAALGPLSLACLAAFVGLQAAYSLGLKAFELVDVLAIAGLFV
ncbi:MAG TPA: hypothetical protein VFL91_07115, partial [Thermomicrobiales bacterium]|nr:hypothetical protein [Thermomicrobiales bacterium]